MFLTLNFPDDEEEKEPETWPPIGSSILLINKVYEPLFFSATWFLEATIDGERYFKSIDRDYPYTDGELRQWARALIRQKQFTLKRMGVDVDKAYVWFGGNLIDLKD